MSSSRQCTDRAFTLVEVLLTTLILAVAFLPLLTSGSAIHRQSYFNEYHTIASIRARTLLDLVRATDHDLLRQASEARMRSTGNPAVPIDVAGLLEPGGFEKLFDPGVTPGDDSGRSFVEKLSSSNFEHEVVFTPRTPDLGEITVVVRWRNPADRGGGKMHEVHLAQLVHRREASFTTP